MTAKNEVKVKADTAPSLDVVFKGSYGSNRIGEQMRPYGAAELEYRIHTLQCRIIPRFRFLPRSGIFAFYTIIMFGGRRKVNEPQVNYLTCGSYLRKLILGRCGIGRAEELCERMAKKLAVESRIFQKGRDKLSLPFRATGMQFVPMLSSKKISPKGGL